MKLNPTIRQFQDAVSEWYHDVFTGTPEEHTHETLGLRFLEEAMELAQAMGVSKDACLRQLNYTYSRPVGTIESELAGSMVTLMHCGYCKQIDIQDAAVRELARIDTDEMRKKIYDKQAYKNSHGLQDGQI